MIIAGLLLLQAVTGGVPAFPGVQPTAEERLALPHVADAIRATETGARLRSLEAALALLPQPTPFRGAFQCVRGPMLLRANAVINRTQGLAAIDECYRLNPDVPWVQRVKADALFFTGIFKGGATLLTSAIRREPRLARGLKDEQLDTIMRRLGYAKAFAERRALVVALAGTDAARNDAARYSGWVRESVLERIGTGDLTEAARLLPYIVDPADGLQMLVDRRYEALWPRIDEWSGGTLEVQREALVHAARASYDIEPTLVRARSVVGLLARTGHVAEGAELMQRAITAFGSPRDDYGYALGVVRLARVIAEAGEQDPERITAPLHAALAGGVAGPMLINVVPNLALIQIALDKPQDALATLERYPSTPGKVETRAAYGYFVAIRGCALAKLDRSAEAHAALADVRRLYAANPQSVDLATACIGSDAEVLAGWLRRVDEPGSRGGAVIEMMRARAGVQDDPLSLGDARLRAVSGRAEVSERLARYARPLAPGYLPALDGWRAAK